MIPLRAPSPAPSPSSPPFPVDDAQLAAFVRTALAAPDAQPGPWWWEPVGYPFDSPTTGGLFRVRGVAIDGGRPRRWSLFVKVLHAFRHWALIDLIPADLRRRALVDPMWQAEAMLYRSPGLHAALPEGLRLPVLYGVQDLGDDRLALWMEDVRPTTTPWRVERFGRAARLLGRLAARLGTGASLPAPALMPYPFARAIYESRLVPRALPTLRDDATWSHPLIAGHPDRRLRADLLELAERVPSMLDALDLLPQTVVHGDASPQNLLVPAAAPDSFVAVDWSMAGRAAVGYDLGQLVVGLAHDGALAPAGVALVAAVAMRAYRRGLADEGMRVAEPVVAFGFRAALVVRSAFTALPLERLAEPPTPELAELMAARLRLTRVLVDIGFGLPYRDITPARAAS